MTRTQALNLLMRAALELAIVIAFAYWGVAAGSGALAKALLGVAAPAIGFGFWGAVDFRGRRGAERLRMAQELAVSALAALALCAAGEVGFGIGLAALSLVYHASVRLSGEPLLKPAATDTAAD